MMKFEKLYRILHNQLKTNLGRSYGSLARIFSYSKVYTKLIIVGNVAMILESVLSIILPVYIGKILDVMKGEDSTANLRSVVHELTIVLFANVILMLARETSFDLLSIKVVRTMRLELFKSLLHKDIEFYDQNKSGDLLSRLTGDIEKVQNSSTNDVTLFVRKIFEIVASLFFVIYISPKLTLILLGFIPVKVFLLGLTGKTTRSNAMLIRTAVADANASANEVFLNIRVIKAFSTEDKEYNLYENKLASTYKLEIYSLFIGLGVFVVRVVLGFGGLLYLIWLGGSMVANQELSAGDLSTFIMCGLTASRGFNSIDRIIKRCAESLGACDRIFEVLDYQPRIKLTADEGITKDKLIGTVGVKDLSFAYPTKNDVTVLKHLDVDIPKGETIALVGASGSGKSTFTNLLQRFYDVSKGEVLIDGENITKYNLKWLHRQIGYVPQEPSLFSGTIEENIAYGVENYTQEDLKHAIEMSNATFIYDKQQFPLGLQTKVGERGTKLSGGQKQRIAIARAVIKNPKILIFDEATSALDAESEHQVQKAVELLMEEGGKTLIIIAHRLSTIINCKRILVFEQGHIVEQGNHKTLLSKEGVYKNLVERQLAGFDAESPRIVRS